MELLYIWIEDYKNIHHQGFNFSPKYRFDYNPETKELTCGEKQGLPDDFFGKDITNVTAIIGENGSGKSSVLEFLLAKNEYRGNFFYIIPYNLYLYQNYKAIVTRGADVYTVNGNNQWENTSGLVSDHKTCISKYRICKLENPESKQSDYEELGVKNFIYYHNEVKYNYEVLSRLYRDITHISTSKYLHDLDNPSGNYGFLSNYGIMQIALQIEFVNWHNKLPQAKQLAILPQPKQIAIRLKILSSTKDSKQFSVYEKFSFLKSFLSNQTRVRAFSNFAQFQQRFYENVFDSISLYISQGIEYRVNKKEEIETKLIEILENNQSVESLVFSLLEDSFFYEEDKFGNFQILEGYKNSIQPFMEFFKNHESAIKNNSFFVDLGTFLTLYDQKIFEKGTFFYLEWATNNQIINLSAGEQHLLGLLSRLKDGLRMSQLNNKNIEHHYYILLDEPDLGLHPDWQKKLLKNLIEVLPQIFPDKKIQLILTSHSPFLVSDLPKENVIFLKKGKDGKCEVSDLANKEQTFGQNIHTLFADSFFMSGGLIGEFAKGKLKAVLENLSKNETEIAENQKLTQAEIEFIIYQIGEPLLRKKFERLYNEKFKSNEFESDESILQKELELKQKLAEIERIKTERNL